MRKHPPGFTFMELLIVAAIIAVLAAILFPVFAQAQNKGRAASCQHNLRQISIALQLYAQDHYGHFPGKDNDFPSLYPYLREEEVFHCPSVDSIPGIALGLSSYAYRGGYCHDDQPNRILVADTQPRHNSGGNLLLLNNQVRWFKQPGKGSGTIGFEGETGDYPERWYVEDGKIVVDEPMRLRGR